MVHELRNIFPSIPNQKPAIVGDNQASLVAVSNNAKSQQLRHVGIKYKFIHDHKSKGNLDVLYTPTQDNLADIMSKPLAKLRNATLRQHIILSINQAKGPKREDCRIMQ